MATLHDTILTDLRTRGAAAYRSSMEAAATATQHVAEADRRLSRAQNELRKGFRGYSAVGNIVRRTTTGVLGLGAAAVYTGLKFDATMEQQQVSFRMLLHSGSAAQQMLGDLFKLAATTPFEFPQLTDAAQKLLGFGMNAKDVLPLLTKVGDAVAAVGADPERIDRITRALGQMQAKGKVYSEELLQLADAGLPAYTMLAKGLGLTGAQLNKKLRKGQVSAEVGLKVLSDQMEKTYRGLAIEQSKTFSGMISTIRDYSRFVLGLAMKPLFNYLRGSVLPGIASFLDRAQSALKDTTLDAQQKFEAIKTAARFHLKPIGEQIVKWWKDEHIGDKLVKEAETWSPKILAFFGKLGLASAKTFLKGWLGADLKTKLFSAALVTFMARGLVGGLIRGAGQILRRGKKGGKGGVIGGMGGGPTGSATDPFFVVVMAGGGGGIPGGGGPLGKASKWAARASKFGPWGFVIAAVAADAYLLKKNWEAERNKHRTPEQQRAASANVQRAYAQRYGNDKGIPILDAQGFPTGKFRKAPIPGPQSALSLRNTRAYRGYTGTGVPPTLSDLNSRAYKGYTGTGRPIEIHSHLHIGDREVAKSVTRATADQMARR